MSENEKNEKKEIEVITGDGENLNISTVYEHIKIDTNEDFNKKKKNVVIPKGNSDK